MDDIKKLTDHVEYLFLKSIINGLQDGSIDILHAKNYATSFLQIEPFISIEDAQQKVSNFVGQHGAFVQMKVYADAFHREQKVDATIGQMSSLIKENKIDEALHVAKG